MSIPSLSVTYVSYYAAPALPASASAPVPAAAPAAAPTEGSQQPQGARRNVLYDAMMSALSELGLTAPAPQAAPVAAPGAAAPTASADPAAPQEAASSSTPNVSDAVFKFADALFQALRAGGEGARGAQRHGDDEHHENQGRHHGHHHGAPRSAEGYAGFARRLEALATAVGAASAPASTSAAPESSTPAPSVVAPPEVVAVPAPAPVAGATTEPSVPAPAAPQTAIGKVTEAFAAMLKALHVSTSSVSSGSTAASQLGAFLHALSQALLPSAAEPAPQMVGLLINVTA